MFDGKKKVYVAGHSGLLGSAVVRRLRKAGVEQIITASHAELDLIDSKAVLDFFQYHKPDYVVLAAGRVGGILENMNHPAAFIEDNLSLQLNVLRAARYTGVTRLLFFGSSCMYPKNCAQPMKEEDLLSGMPEITSLPYAIAKLAGLYQCLAYNKQENAIRFIPVIPSTLYGPHDNFDPKTGHVLPALLARFHEAKKNNLEKVVLWGSGAPVREFIHVDDVAEACYFLLDADIADAYLPMNIGTGQGTSIKELAQTIIDIVGFKGLVEWDRSKPDGSPFKVQDSTRIMSKGWKARIELKQGIADTYHWLQQEVDSRTEIETGIS